MQQSVKSPLKLIAGIIIDRKRDIRTHIVNKIDFLRAGQINHVLLYTYYTCVYTYTCAPDLFGELMNG